MFRKRIRHSELTVDKVLVGEGLARRHIHLQEPPSTSWGARHRIHRVRHIVVVRGQTVHAVFKRRVKFEKDCRII